MPDSLRCIAHLDMDAIERPVSTMGAWCYAPADDRLTAGSPAT